MSDQTPREHVPLGSVAAELAWRDAKIRRLETTLALAEARLLAHAREAKADAVVLDRARSELAPPRVPR